jgi:short-subunit dehydrogenase
MAYVALITGASSGIGQVTARRLAREPDTRLVLVARRRERLQALADELGNATVIAADLTEPGAPERVLDVVQREYGQLHMLVNNAGGAWRESFADGGWANVERHMKLDFEAPVRLTEALLPLLRATAAPRGERRTAAPRGERRVCIVNVSSTSGRIGRPRSGGYTAAKFALAGWSDSLAAEETQHGIHVGLVLPGFIKTEGFPATELLASALTRWLVSSPEAVAEAILQAGPGGRAERYVPRYYWVAAALRILAPGLIRRAVSGGAFNTSTAGDD